MLTVLWRRYVQPHSDRLSRQNRPARIVRGLPRLEWLESRELLSANNVLNAVPVAANNAQNAVPQYILEHDFGTALPMGAPGVGGYTPDQIRHAYGFDQISFLNGSVPANGKGQTIAIVDAYDDPTAAGDLQTFSQTFNLITPTITTTYSYNANAPTPTFTQVNQTGGTTLPSGDPGWAGEIALDVEWAHAVAPGANILLVEANSPALTDLFSAVQWAASQPGVSVVSMSFGGGEFGGETTFDNTFTTPAGHNGVSFIAASGDYGAPASYPATSPNVLAIGGTSLFLNGSNNYSSESAWSGSGGGISIVERQPAYQNGIVTQSTTMRTNPDVAYDADPNTGFPVLATYAFGGWGEVGGTSDAAPQWSALVAIANQGRMLNGQSTLDGPTQLLPLIYQMPFSNFHDVTTGSSLGSPNYPATPGYDLSTGRGTPFANLVVNSLTNGVTGLLKDPGFELPPVGSGYAVDPAGSPWTFTGGAGVAGNGSGITSGNPNAPQGTQVGWLQNNGTISQTVTFAPGAFTVSFDAAQPPTIPVIQASKSSSTAKPSPP